MTCERKPGAKPAIPPGMRMQLETLDARLRALGITQDEIDRTIDAAVRMAQVEALLADIVGHAFLRFHAADGWLARRRLRKELGTVRAVIAHFDACSRCRANVDGIRETIIDALVFGNETAPTE